MKFKQQKTQITNNQLFVFSQRSKKSRRCLDENGPFFNGKNDNM